MSYTRGIKLKSLEVGNQGLLSYVEASRVEISDKFNKEIPNRLKLFKDYV